jgi:phosphoglycerate dehydrogenase-like enzyme
MIGKRILVWTGGDDEALCAAIGSPPGAHVHRARDRAAALEGMRNAHALVTSSAFWDAEFAHALTQASDLTWIQIVNAGFDNMEREGIPKRVVLSTIGGLGATVVAEHALLLLLALLRQMPAALHAQRDRDWAHQSLSSLTSTLRGKMVAVIGFGHIGQAVTSRALAFDARVTAVARRARSAAGAVVVRAFEDLSTVLSEADAVVICAPLNESTELLMNKTAFAATKPGCYLVNVARGRIVDTEALVRALDSGRIAGAALDVTDPEPLPRTHELWTHPNVLLTPHVASSGGGQDVRDELERVVAGNVLRFVRGEKVRNVAAVRYTLNS